MHQSSTGSGCDPVLRFHLVLHQALRLPAGRYEGRAGDFARHVAHQRSAAQTQRLFMHLVAPFGPFVLQKSKAS